VSGKKGNPSPQAEEIIEWLKQNWFFVALLLILFFLVLIIARAVRR